MKSAVGLRGCPSCKLVIRLLSRFRICSLLCMFRQSCAKYLSVSQYLEFCAGIYVPSPALLRSFCHCFRYPIQRCALLTSRALPARKCIYLQQRWAIVLWCPLAKLKVLFIQGLLYQSLHLPVMASRLMFHLDLNIYYPSSSELWDAPLGKHQRRVNLQIPLCCYKYCKKVYAIIVILCTDSSLALHAFPSIIDTRNRILSKPLIHVCLVLEYMWFATVCYIRLAWIDDNQKV